jgi:dihydrolipoamide dehydrogenase
VETLFKNSKVERIQGEATFKNPYEIEVAQAEGRILIRAKNFIIATGSEPTALPFLPFDEKQIVSSTGALSLPKIPETLLVIGAGAIGLELASVYGRLGSKIKIIEMLDRAIPNMDETLSKQLLQVLKKQGMEFYLKAKVKEAKRSNKAIELLLDYQNETISLTGDIVLVSIGRKPYTKHLNLAAINVVTNPLGYIQVDGNFRTGHSHIYAIGDTIDGPMLAHKASHEGVAVAGIIAGKQPTINYISIPNVVYTHPEVASVGLTETEAKLAGFSLAVGTSYFRGNARARCTGDTEGLVKILGDKKSGRLIGLHLIGLHVSEMIGEGVVALERHATLQDLAHAPHPHPTLSEAIMEAAQNAIYS